LLDFGNIYIIKKTLKPASGRIAAEFPEFYRLGSRNISLTFANVKSLYAISVSLFAMSPLCLIFPSVQKVDRA
jgi:hypothetical protein